MWTHVLCGGSGTVQSGRGHICVANLCLITAQGFHPPTQNVLTIRCHPKTGERTLGPLKWGLIPNWAKDEKIGYKTINARVETVDSAPSYRHAFRKRRCLIPADGFYEWRKVLGGKIPYNIQMKDGRPFVFAGLWEGWKPPGSEDWIRTCTIITGEPNELIRQIHTLG